MSVARGLALAAGMLFALGLGIAGMTQPARVIGFLDFGGQWDPSLMFVMLGAVAVHAVLLRTIRRDTPFFGAGFEISGKSAIDRPLVLGAALFGLGWGVTGFCPGPAVVAIASLSPSTLTFVAGMVLGMLAVQLVRASARPVQSASSSDA